VPQAIEPFESIAIMPIVSYLISYCAGRRGIAHRTAAHGPSALQRSTCCNAAHVATQHMLQRSTCCDAAQHSLVRAPPSRRKGTHTDTASGTPSA
jgi:hypothetical protein